MDALAHGAYNLVEKDESVKGMKRMYRYFESMEVKSGFC